MARRRARTGMYWEGFTAEERALLEHAAGRVLLEDEVALLRVLIRRLVIARPSGSGEDETTAYATIGRMVEQVARLMRTRQQVEGGGEEEPRLQGLLAQVAGVVLTEKQAAAREAVAREDGAT